MVSTPGASVAGWIQNGGHLREVFANAGLTVFFWFWLRMMLTSASPCLTLTLSMSVVILTSAACELAMEKPSPSEARRIRNRFVFMDGNSALSRGCLRRHSRLHEGRSIPPNQAIELYPITVLAG